MAQVSHCFPSDDDNNSEALLFFVFLFVLFCFIMGKPNVLYDFSAIGLSLILREKEGKRNPGENRDTANSDSCQGSYPGMIVRHDVCK